MCTIDADGIDGGSGALQQQQNPLFEVLHEATLTTTALRVDQHAGALLEFGQCGLERALVPRARSDEDGSVGTEKPAKRLEPGQMTARDGAVLPAIHGTSIDEGVVVRLMIRDEDHRTLLGDPLETDADHPVKDLHPDQAEK